METTLKINLDATNIDHREAARQMATGIHNIMDNVKSKQMPDPEEYVVEDGESDVFAVKTAILNTMWELEYELLQISDGITPEMRTEHTNDFHKIFEG